MGNKPCGRTIVEMAHNALPAFHAQGRPSLSCHGSQNVESLFPQASTQWSARDVALVVENVRARAPPVPFYLYDEPVLPVSMRKELAKLDRCGVWAKQYQYGGESWFLRSLLDHPWRVSNSSKAELLVIPSLHAFQVPRGRGGAPKSTFCRGLTPQAALDAAIVSTHEWRTRKGDHVYVGLEWEYNCLPTPTGCMATHATPSSNAGNAQSEVHGDVVGGRGALMRAFIETRLSHPLTGRVYTKRTPPEGEPRLLVAPYVDNGHGVDHHTALSYARQWAADEREVGSAYAAGASLFSDENLPRHLPLPPSGEPSDAPAAAADTEASAGMDHLSHHRDIAFFFGGRTSRTIGPGRRGLGYYVRWALMRHWKAEVEALPWALRARVGVPGAAQIKAPVGSSVRLAMGSNTGLAAPSAIGSGPGVQHIPPLQSTPQPRPLPPFVDSVLIVDSDRGRERLVVPFCANGTSAEMAARAPHLMAGQELPATTTAACLAPCNDLKQLAHGACHGSYHAGEVLRRSRFSLCLRGDSPSSSRLYDAVRYGAIPLFVSDHIWRVGLPFQCWVPWRLLSRTVPEGTFLHDPGAALRNVSATTDAFAEKRMRGLLGYFARDLLWRHPRSRVAENVLRAAANARRRGGGFNRNGGRKARKPCCPFEDLDEDNA